MNNTFSVTQIGNYTAIAGFLALILDKYGVNISQADALTILLGIITIGGQIISVYGRYRHGDVNVLGIKTPEGEMGNL